MKRRLILPLLAFAAIAHAEPKPPVIPADPAEAAKAFYAKVRALNFPGLPKGQDWIALLPLVTEEFATAMLGAQAEQAEAIKNAPDEKPPWIEGDLFSSVFEGVQHFIIGKARVTGDKAEVPVTCTYTEGGDTVKWTDTLLMVRTAKGWLFDDMRFGGTGGPAPKDTLKQGFAPEVN